MEATAILSIFRQAETVFPETENYIFSLLLPTDSPLQSPQTIYTPVTVNGTRKVDKFLREQLNDAMSAAVRQLRRGYGARGTGHAGGPLERLGGVLFNIFLPRALQEAFYSLPAGLPIILTSNDGSVPWELLHDGTEFLALKHPIGRSLWGTPMGRQVSHKGRRSLLLISNPTGDLEQADIEADELIDYIFDPERINSSGGQRIYPNLLARPRATKFAVLQALGSQVDLIHYSGHATPGKLLLADDEVTIEEIHNAIYGQPFVFLNACWSARETKESGSLEPPELDSFVPRDFAEAFISAGAIGFIGTLWPLFDHTSREFAHLFYSYCKNGMPVGEALRQTRCKMREKWPDDPIWASFVFYGDPSLHLLPAMSQAQTRHITVLVARLQGLSGLFDSVGIEQAASMLDDLNTSIQKITQTYQGKFYAPLTGVWKIHFGISATHDRDAEHAIRAALNMIQLLRAFNETWQTRLPIPLTLQVGISTERVLVQRITSALNYQIMGQVERIADHLAMPPTKGDKDEMAAIINQIVVDEATYRLSNEQFAFDSLASLPIIDQKPLQSYRVVGTTRPPASITIIGREDKLAHLASFWQQVKKRRGRVVGISGDAGIGKTCLVKAFGEQIDEQDEPHLWIAATAHSYHQKQSYGLLALVVRQLAQIKPHDEERAQRDKIKGLVAHLKPPQMNEAVALLAHVVGWQIQLPEVNNLEPKLRQKRLAEVVADILRQQSTSQPIILVLDDLQWADDATLSILDQLMRHVRGIRLLLLLVYRANWEWPHQKQRHKWIQSLKVEELAEEACGMLLANLLGVEPSPELDELILKQTGGHPLFVKEYIQLLQENGCFIRAGSGALQVTDLSQIPLLNKVERVIQTRLDQLTDSASQVIQNASVIGEQFEEDLLEKIQDVIANESLEDDLDLLSERRMIEILGGTPFLYRFSHGLVHEIVYQLLPEGLQRATHRFVAQALHHLHGDKVDLYRLAHHYYHSNDDLNAIRYALAAAKRDAQQWANHTAVEWYGRALEKIDNLTSSQANDAEKAEREQTITPTQRLNWQLEALEGQADVQKTIGDTDEAIKGYTQALDLIRSDGCVTRRANFYYKLATAHHDKGQFGSAQDALNNGLAVLDGLACLEAGRIHIYTGLIHYRHGRLSDGLLSCEQGIAIIQKTESIRDLAQAHNLQGILYRNMGEGKKAIVAHEQSIVLYQQAQYLPGLARAYSNLGCVYQDLGPWHKALHYFQKNAELSEQTGEDRRRAAAANDLGEIYRRQGQLEKAINVYGEAREMVEQLGFKEFLAIARMNLGACLIKKGELAEAEKELQESEALFRELEADVHLPEVMRYQAELAIARGQFTQAQQLARKALHWALELERRLEEGQARRTLGQVACLLGQIPEANTHLNKSLTILQERNSPYEVGLTWLELAQLRQTQALSDENKHHSAPHQQATAASSRAIAIFEELGAALELKRAQELRLSLHSQ